MRRQRPKVNKSVISTQLEHYINAKRLSTILSTAKVGAMSLVIAIGMVACGSPKTETEAVATDSTVVSVDSTTAVAVDTTTATK